MAATPITCRIAKIVQATPDTKVFHLVPVEPFDFQFKPGQFLNLYLNKEGEPPNARPYSICSSPLNKDYIELTIKIRQNFTQKVNQLKEGDTVRIAGPFGIFVFDEDKMKHIVIMAGGCGIAPYISMIRYVNEKNLGNKLTVFYSARTHADFAHYEELDRIRKENRNIGIVFTCTREPEGSPWKGERGRINEDMLRRHLDSPDGKHYFLCGPAEMVESGVQMLKNIGAKKESIVAERWG